jgi:RNA polymerase sigma-70 factor (ECF subfamily)
MPSAGGPPETLDAATAVAALGKIDEAFRAPVALYYLEDFSYLEIAAILGIPLGTVKSRISRGVAQLHTLLLGRPQDG